LRKMLIVSRNIQRKSTVHKLCRSIDSTNDKATFDIISVHFKAVC